MFSQQDSYIKLPADAIIDLPRIDISPLHQDLPLRRELERHTAILANVVSAVLVLRHAVDEIATAGRVEVEILVGVAKDEVDIAPLCYVAVLGRPKWFPDEDVVQNPGFVEVPGYTVGGVAGVAGVASVGGEGDDV